MSLFDKHRTTLLRAVQAVEQRDAWTPFTESPSRKLHPEGAKATGKSAFEARLNRRFELDLVGAHGWVGEELSPYTRQPLGIEYPRVDPKPLCAHAHSLIPAWRKASVETRVGVCLEMLDRWRAASFENAFATMHTAGQSFMMAFAGSGANSLDRGLEGLVYAYKAMKDVPTESRYVRSFGRGPKVELHKRYRLVPRGVAVVIACGTYPAWNAYPAILANLATGNPVVLKPHPNAILPMAIAVEKSRDVLRDSGFSPDLISLAADVPNALTTQSLLTDEHVAIVDFTGSQRFGSWIENHCRDKLVYTETAGCNAVVVDSVHDLEPVLDTLAQGLSLFSAQMCTSPQNVFVPQDGVRTSGGTVSFDEFCGRLVEQVDGLVAEGATAAGVCGAIQVDETLREIDELRAKTSGRLVRDSSTYEHPEYPKARTATPLIVRAEGHEEYRREFFGPMSFVIKTNCREQALLRASTDARECGAIASYAYSTDGDFIERIEDAFVEAGASVGINLIGQRPMNFTAAYSDFHVTGLNPAGTACLTDLAFVADRFRIVQSKREIPKSAGDQNSDS